MAGIGVKLNSIFQKNSIAADLVGFTYSTAVTVCGDSEYSADGLGIGIQYGRLPQPGIIFLYRTLHIYLLLIDSFSV